MTHFLDPVFEYHRATGLVWLNIALQLVTTPLLPYNVTDYGVFVKLSANQFAQSYEQRLLEHNIALSEYMLLSIAKIVIVVFLYYLALFNASVEMLVKACDSFQAKLDHAQDEWLR